jgi:putative ABC transport system ATP-binding protein
VLRFGADVALDLPALSAGPGTLLALTGPSGAGKSSMLYLLSGLLKAGEGTILWGDVDLGTLSESQRDRWRRRTAGFIFQDFRLIEEMSPLDNVLVPAWLAGFSARSRRSRAEDLLERFGVPADRSRISLLSRGEQQRVAIARALLLDPPIVFADEPTASLDAAAGTIVISALKGLAAEGRTVVTATHDPLLRDAASQVLMLDHGHAQSSRPTVPA